MRICAFVGKSGTGKSYRAQWVAREHNLEYVIDDGLLIKNNKIVCGKSAKKEKSKVASVKRAIFNNKEDRDEMIAAIEKEIPSGILILGTSVEMVNKIVAALELPDIEKYIYIEDVATEAEIKKAQYMRHEMGKHVIPVPTIEVKSQFSGYFLNPLKIFKSRSKENEIFESEKTIVRPAFSYIGEYTISEKVITSLVYHTSQDIKGIQRMLKIKSKNTYDGLVLTIEIAVFYGIPINEIMTELATKVKSEIEKLTALNIIELNVETKYIFMV